MLSASFCAASTVLRGASGSGTIGRQQSGASMGRIRIGIGGWNFPEWRGGTFYPADLPHIFKALEPDTHALLVAEQN